MIPDVSMAMLVALVTASFVGYVLLARGVRRHAEDLAALRCFRAEVEKWGACVTIFKGLEASLKDADSSGALLDEFVRLRLSLIRWCSSSPTDPINWSAVEVRPKAEEDTSVESTCRSRVLLVRVLAENDPGMRIATDWLRDAQPFDPQTLHDAVKSLLERSRLTQDCEKINAALGELAIRLLFMSCSRSSAELDAALDMFFPQMSEPTEPEAAQVNEWLELLGVEHDSDMTAIRTAYRRRVREWHPDRLQGAAQELQAMAHERLTAINAAYEQLTAKRIQRLD